MACNDQLMIIYSTEIIVPGIFTSCPESCKQLSWSRYHSLDDQVIIPQKVVGGFHDAAGFITPEHMTMSPITMLTLMRFPEPSHRCTTTLVTPCPRCHTDQFQNQGVDHHAGGGALPNAIVPKLRSSPEPTARHLCNRFPCPLCHPGRTEAEDYRDEISKHHVVSEELRQNPCPKYQQVRDLSQNVVLDTSCCASAGVEVMTFNPIVDPMRSLPDGGHRCTEFPCPKCHRRRSQNVVLDNSCASAGVELMTFNPIVDPMRTLPDGGHRCTQFPCPKCHGRRSQNAVHGVQRINVSESGLPNPVPEVVKISFPEPPGHRCNRFPCPVCPPSAMSTAEVGHDEISKHHAISEEMQTPRPKYQQVRGRSQNVVLDNSSCASAGIELMTFNPIVDPMRTLPDGGHRCTQFPCPKCHGRRSQNAGHGVQSINVSESGLPDPVPEVVKISFPEPTGHRCNRYPCPLCHPGRSSPSAMSTAEVGHHEISKHHVISEELQNPCPKYPQVRGRSQNVVLDNSCCASAGVEFMTFNPIVDPMRTLPDGGHRCTQFPCPKCHGRRSQNAAHGVQRINVSESGLPNPVPEVVIKISFPEPTGHRCNRFPCPLCHPEGRSSPPAMSTAEVDDDENSKHHVVCEEMQTPGPKYPQVRADRFIPRCTG